MRFCSSTSTDDVKPACYQDRDNASHNALGAEMLYRGVIGSEPLDHPELQAFKRGFMLSCRNGFNLSKVIVLSSLPPCFQIQL